MLELTRENNRMLRKMARRSRFHRVLAILYFLILLGGMLYLYYYLQPYIEKLFGMYEMISSYEVNSGAGVENFLDTFKETGTKTSQ